MYKLVYTTNGTEYSAYYNDLEDAQEGARYARINLNAVDIWISRED